MDEAHGLIREAENMGALSLAWLRTPPVADPADPRQLLLFEVNSGQYEDEDTD